MGQYGSDDKPDMNVATDLALIDKIMPFDKTYTEQWSYPDNVFVVRLAARQGKSRLLIRIDKTIP